MAVPRERVRVFWRARLAGATIGAAAAAAGVSDTCARRWIAKSGGMIPPDVDQLGSGQRDRFLEFGERVEIMIGLRAGLSVRSIARGIDRSPSTVSRELKRGQTLGDRRAPAPAKRKWRGVQKPLHERLHYCAATAQAKAEAGGRRAPRPTQRRLVRDPQLHTQVATRLAAGCSPEQISHRLILDFPGQERMRVSHETIYQCLYLQGRGELRRELTRHLRTGRALRHPRRISGERRGRRTIPEEIRFSSRPAHINDRAVAGHWEGDLILGRYNKSAVGTLVERTTRFVMLLHLPHGHGAEAVRDAILATMPTLPAHLWRSLTWDQGIEMTRHAEITIATDLDIYFCDPHSPWQRGTNENTNGLLRQYLPKATDLSTHTTDDLNAIADKLNTRPRKTLDWKTPAETLNQLLSTPPTNGVASLT